MMTDPDPVLARLAALPAAAPSADLSTQIRAASLARLRRRPLHPAWALLVAGSVVGYLVSALVFTVELF